MNNLLELTIAALAALPARAVLIIGKSLTRPTGIGSIISGFGAGSMAFGSTMGTQAGQSTGNYGSDQDGPRFGRTSLAPPARH
jgi:hypothetical protein